MPSRMALNDNFAPCMKNNNAIARLVKDSKKVLILPSQGKNVAVITTIIKVNKKGSIFNNLMIFMEILVCFINTNDTLVYTR